MTTLFQMLGQIKLKIYILVINGWGIIPGLIIGRQNGDWSIFLASVLVLGTCYTIAKRLGHLNWDFNTLKTGLKPQYAFDD